MMAMIDISFRVIAISLLLTRHLVWYYSGKNTEKKQPITHFAVSLTSYRSFNKIATRLFGIFALIQLAGFHVLPIHEQQIIFQTVGITVAIVGFAVGVAARIQLGDNWAHAADYQVKTRQQLVTTGVYHHIRHPIYTGLSLLLIGSEMVALSWLFVPIAILLFGSSYVQAKKEEAILLAGFGKAYEAYKRRSWMLIPYVI